MLLICLSLVVVASLAQQAEVSPPLTFNARTPYTFPQEVFEFLERWNWGDFHLVFHMARKYYVLGDSARQWIDRIMEKPGPYQEGDPLNGIEFLTMHRAMLEYLAQRFGSLPLNGDPEGRRTVRDALQGWSTDEQAIAGLRALGGDANTFQAGLQNINNFASFKNEDEFGLFIQTSMRLQGTVDNNNPSARRYNYDRRPGSGVHNWMHGQLHDGNSPITVGDPRTNLPNILFWRIHGWIENKWKAFEAARQRTAQEKQVYDGMMTQFRAHMISMSEQGPGGGPPATTVASRARETTTTTSSSRRRTTTTNWRRTTRRPSSSWGSSGRGLFGVRSDLRRSERGLNRNVRQIDNAVETIADRDDAFLKVDRVRRSLARIHQGTRGRHVPWDLVYHLRPRMFRNRVPECRTLAVGTYTEDCPESNLTPQRASSGGDSSSNGRRRQ